MARKAVLAALVLLWLEQVCSETSVKDVSEGDILKRLSILEAKQRESEVEIRALRETVTDQRNTITTLKVSQHRQTKRCQRTEKVLKTLLQKRPRSSEGPGRDAYDQRAHLQHLHGNEEENVHGRNSKRGVVDGNVNLRGSKRQVPEVVAFTVYLDHDENLGIHQVIKFNKVITNEGGGYNNNTGVFTCVTDGMYLIYFAIGERDAHQQTASLRVNNQNIVDATVEATRLHQDLQGGNMAAIRLHQGDSVWIESMDNNHHVEGSSGIRTTTFTGVLLYY